MTLSTSTVTLAPGSSRTYTLAPGEAVTVATEPNCYVTVTETPDVIATADQGGQTNVRTSILQYKGEWTYGPYALGGTVVVDVSLAKSTSSVSATLGSAAAAVVGATLRQRGAPAAVTGTTAATLLCPGAEITAGIMGINSILRIESAWSSSATTNLRTMTIKIGATEGAAVEIWSRARSSASSISEVPLIILQNRGAIDSQVFYTSAGMNYGSNLSIVPETKTINFSVAQYVYFYGQVASASDNVTLHGYNIAIN